MGPVDSRRIRSRDATSIPDSTAPLALFFRRYSPSGAAARFPRQEAQNPREESANRNRGLPLGMSYSVLNLPVYGSSGGRAFLIPSCSAEPLPVVSFDFAKASHLLLGDSPLQLGGLRHLTLSTESGTDPVSPGSP